uniref:Transcription factor CBF/NF-Y/archaeal histone domain-containing protein n=1 Tax=Panagrolaimus superbus TaxID=310955 RepID=A0A914YCB2_9BILA
MPLERGANAYLPKPDPPKRKRRDWPCMKRLKEIAEKLGKEFENRKISASILKGMLEVQVAANIKHEDIKKKTLKDSLDMILMEVNGV